MIVVNHDQKALVTTDPKFDNRVLSLRLAFALDTIYFQKLWPEFLVRKLTFLIGISERLQPLMLADELGHSNY